MTDVEVPISARHGSDRLIQLIGAFKLLKGLLLALAGFATLRLLHRDVDEVVTNWAWKLHLDPGGRFVGRLLERVGGVDDRALSFVTAGMFFYAALLLIEAVGLLLRRRWAEYFTIIVTGSFIPLEAWELMKRFTLIRMSVIIVNVAVVWYLIVRLRRDRAAEAGPDVPEATGERTT